MTLFLLIADVEVQVLPLVTFVFGSINLFPLTHLTTQLMKFMSEVLTCCYPIFCLTYEIKKT